MEEPCPLCWLIVAPTRDRGSVSVGYGVSAGGQAALHGMLASCAPGLSVVNIDNGYGAAMAALRILLSSGAAASGKGRSSSSTASTQRRIERGRRPVHSGPKPP